MARIGDGWIYTTDNDDIHHFYSNNIPIQFTHHLPSSNIRSNEIDVPSEKQWTDQSLLSNTNIKNYLIKSDMSHQIAYKNIIDKCKQLKIDQTNQLISLFDAHYNMHIHFRKDNKLNKKYYRLLKNDKPYIHCKRLIKEYEERELLKFSSINKIQH
ncbi:unnamed protein product [Adineta steineri]|uniref:Uncharacterized protein n=1 Tax=Adineta steineri TaxID=433720 RepID=A0A814CU68_9BILA|nr:unnamed protein product [Adineta steineri]CAF3490196.1 unnamed protein product [Adineta steineri]